MEKGRKKAEQRKKKGVRTKAKSIWNCEMLSEI